MPPFEPADFFVIKKSKKKKHSYNISNISDISFSLDRWATCQARVFFNGA